MLIRRAEQVRDEAMTIPGARAVKMRVMVGRADGAPTFAMRQFEVEPGGCTPLHQHNYEHEILVLSGAGQAVGGLDGSTIRPLQPGDVVFMPPNEKHQFRNVGQEPLRFICLIPVSFDCGNGTCQPTPGC